MDWTYSDFKKWMSTECRQYYSNSRPKWKQLDGPSRMRRATRQFEVARPIQQQLLNTSRMHRATRQSEVSLPR